MVALAAVILVGSFSGAFVYFDSVFGKFGECRIVHLTDVPSPDGSKTVITYRKECGATVPVSTQASIASSSSAFALESTSPFFSVAGQQDIVVTWVGDRTLKIGLIPGTDKIHQREKISGGIEIKYD